jgi:hypothetical protein
MAGAVAKRQGDLFDAGVGAGSSRPEVISRYRHLRAISTELHDQILKRVSTDVILRQGRRLGLASGRTWSLEDEHEIDYAFDLAVHTAAPGKARAVDRYAQATKFAPGSDEDLVLKAMCKAEFTLICVEKRHKTAGLIVTDICRSKKLWLMDEGLERSAPRDEMIATRLFTPGAFSMTCGVAVLVDAMHFAAALMDTPQLGDKDLEDAAHDPRFAEALYRVALASGEGRIEPLKVPPAPR